LAKYVIEGESIYDLYCAIGRIVEKEIYAAKRPNAPIDALHLKPRTRNALLANGIESVEQLIDEADRAKFLPNIGKVGLADIARRLSEWKEVNG
jgi:DNA-directed RNA polymerase alpha subunit